MKSLVFNIYRVSVLSLVTILYIIVFTPFTIVSTPIFFGKIAFKFIKYQGIRVGDMGYFTDLLESIDLKIHNLFFQNPDVPKTNTHR